MGLDMYLSKKTYVKRWDHTPAKDKFAVTVLKGGEAYPAIKSERISYIEEEVMYWRKSNAIHSWFVKNVQEGVDNCQSSYVPVEKLEELHNLVSQVLIKGTQTAAMKLLPPQSGFFFGSTEVDEWYWQDLRDTKKALGEILEEPTADCGEYYYRASW